MSHTFDDHACAKASYSRQFTRRWFRVRNQSTFERLIKPHWVGQPITYLEVGVFEGQSLVWMLENVLTHRRAKAIGVDPWLMTLKIDADAMEAVMQRAHHNTEPWRSKCQLVRGASLDVLGRMTYRQGYMGVTKQSIDVCMIDGQHTDLGVWGDARLASLLVKPKGWLLFDDVVCTKRKSWHVRQGIDMFLNEAEGRVRFLWADKFMECYEVV